MYELKIYLKDQLVATCPSSFIPRVGERFIVKTDSKDGEIEVVNGIIYSVEYISYLGTRNFEFNIRLY